MEYVYLSAIIGLCLFNFWAYRRGLQDGLALNQGKPIEPIQNPVKTVIQYVETKKEHMVKEQANSDMMEGFNNLMSYDGNDQTKGGER